MPDRDVHCLILFQALRELPTYPTVVEITPLLCHAEQFAAFSHLSRLIADNPIRINTRITWVPWNKIKGLSDICAMEAAVWGKDGS